MVYAFAAGAEAAQVSSLLDGVLAATAEEDESLSGDTFEVKQHARARTLAAATHARTRTYTLRV